MEKYNLYPINEGTLKLLFEKILELNQLLNNEIIILSEAEYNQNRIYKLSSIYISLINRAIELNNGYISLFNLKNYLTAISLLRIQIENCLRFHGLRILDNMPYAFDEFLSGKELREMTGNDGKKLYDTYLAKELDRIYPEYNFKGLYKQYCEIIHFSVFYQNIGTEFLDDGNGVKATIYLGGGSINPHFNIENQINYTISIFYTTKLLYKLFSTYSKKMREILEKK